MTPEFFAGIAAATFGGAAIFFLRFWRASRDRFYLQFCVACLFLAAQRPVHVVVQLLIDEPVSERGVVVYLMRLGAFLAILIAVIDKNRS